MPEMEEVIRMVWWIRPTPLGATITRAEMVADFPGSQAAVLRLPGARPMVSYGEIASSPARAAAMASGHLEAIEELERLQRRKAA